MKIAIVSDLHIGYERFEEDSYKQAREALFSAAESADAILVAGDVFDKRAPKPEVIAKAIDIFREISKREWKARVKEFRSETNKSYTDVPIIVIPGTHERVAEGKENVLGLLALAGLVVDASESTAIIELQDERVAVFGLGGVSEERVREALSRLKPKPVPGAFNIFMMHQSIYELLPFSDNIIKYEELPAGFDLYVNGHIHNRVEATVHGKKFLIPGSTVLTQLKDGEQAGKGFILFDTKSYSHEFRSIKSRAFISLTIKVKDASPKSVLENCEKEIDGALAKNKDKPIIKIRLEGSIAKGFTGSDMPLRSLVAKYSAKAFLEIDQARLKSEESIAGLDELRDSLSGGMTVRQLGMSTFASKLKEYKFDDKIDANRLFEILGASTNKEKMLKAVAELFEDS